ncbi:hypothetical protein HELRODRAFT_166464 [Helobdella robusta]|uniref:SUEL-type lectin domain-containing protein n=1 Tax=Helobdella robusta TaxID=6412 RepID=T1EY57_HELRO|nr:hypothetical protein HELRODRAFT_166464 [Helobdella robusta]ESN90762.1 hypothetical protein HELRODRAFT_166464 [Helobdella robusta]
MTSFMWSCDFLEYNNNVKVRGPAEYCYYEKFEPRCEDGDVIIIINATYGRMSFGRCVRTNFGFIGCFDDVTGLLHRKCTGRQGCAVHVVEPTFSGLKPCNMELKSYLRVEFVCVPELKLNDDDDVEEGCNLEFPSREIPMATLTPTLMMTSLSLTGSLCGDDQSPFRIKTKPGQRLNVTMIIILESDQSELANVANQIVWTFSSPNTLKVADMIHS